MALPVNRPSKPERGWRIWDGATEFFGFVFALPLLPFVAVGRGFARIGQRSHLASYRSEQQRSRHELEVASKNSLIFLDTYLKRLVEIRSRYLATPWNSLEEAEAGWRLLQAAEAALFMEAEAAAQKLTVQARTQAQS